MNSITTYEEAPFDPSAAGEIPVARNRRIDERALSLVERYVQAVINRRLLILAIVLLSMTVGVIAYLMATPQYRATARLEIARSQPKVIQVAGVEMEDRGRDIQFYETQYQLLRAKSLAERVARALGLQNDDHFFELFGGPKADALASRQTRGAADQAVRLNAAAAILLANVEIKPVGNSNLVDVHFTSPDAALSARVANAWTQEYIQSNLDRRFAATADARGFLEQRLNQLRTRLEASERELVAYASGKGIVTLSSGGGGDNGVGKTERTLVMDDLASLNTALSAATAERISAEAALRAAAANPNAPGQTTIATLRQRRAELAAKYASLLTTLTPANPQAAAMRTEILTLDEAIAAETGRTRNDAEAVYRSALAKENQLRARLEQLKGGYNIQRTNMIEYQILDREVDTNRQLYDSLLQRYKEIGVAGVGSNNVSVVDMADVPNAPFEPNLQTNLAVSLLIGLLLAAGMVIAAEEVDQSLRDPADVQRELGLPLIGTIPRVDDKDVAEELRDKKTQIYESYLAVRTNLSFLTDHGAPKVFMLTSSRPNEGKSLSAYALARLFGETGARVILIDADMRNTRLDDLVELREGPGLSNYLSGSTEMGAVIQRPEAQNFAMIPAGPIPPNAAELLASERFKELLARLRDSYDHVIIDAPPVLGLADAPLLTRLVDGVLFVIESNVGKLRLVRGALRRLELPGAKIFGALVTKLDGRNLTYGYGYGYGYGSYGYGRARAAKQAEAQAAE